MSEKVAIVYWCDGTGHAARSIPVLKELESRDIDTAVAGGGPGKKFVEMNGFDHPDLTTVKLKGSNPLKAAKNVIFDVVPSSIKRFVELNRWLKEEDPDKIVTDDLLAVISASLQRRELYRIDHLTPDMFQNIWGPSLSIYNSLTMFFGERIIVTSLWKDEEDSQGIKKVGPLAQEGETDEDIESYDVLLSPGTHGEDFDEIRERLEKKDLDVRTVGDDQWETKPSMTPYTEKADAVICTGFSSIADTVVAGTPCVVYPFLPFQKALADGIEKRNLNGLKVVKSIEEAVQSTVECVEGKAASPIYENGASEFVDQIT